MERVVRSNSLFILKTYIGLTKPGIVMGNAMTCAGGFAFAAQGQFDSPLFAASLMGLSLIVATGCVANNCIDRARDAQMERTKQRALVRGEIALPEAKRFALILGVLGTVSLALFANVLSAILALVGLFVYLVLYTISKYRSEYGTLIGAIAGAIPPVVGYCTVTGVLDGGALMLFAILMLWQMPHFYAIAIYRLKEYEAAAIPVLPIQRGMRVTKIHMLLYIVAFLAVSLMPTFFGYTGRLYGLVTALLGGVWLWCCVQGFWCKSNPVWARKMFVMSLAVITGLCLTIPLRVI
ncbi:MAG: protoheme IX farnesyltransferase [Chlamydiia bacterium]|nr:protoheme IX farnesyltransferase [Chlamydiia bacterium]